MQYALLAFNGEMPFENLYNYRAPGAGSMAILSRIRTLR